MYAVGNGTGENCAKCTGTNLKYPAGSACPYVFTDTCPYTKNGNIHNTAQCGTCKR